MRHHALGMVLFSMDKVFEQLGYLDLVILVYFVVMSFLCYFFILFFVHFG